MGSVQLKEFSALAHGALAHGALAHGVLQDHLMENFTTFQSGQNTHGMRKCPLSLQGFHMARDSADAD